MECCCCVCGYSKSGMPADSETRGITAYGDIYSVTHNGKPSGKLLAHICARCLRRANEMRGHVKSILSNVQVSRHALDRFLERQAGERISSESAKVAILKMFSHARKIVFKDRFMAQRLTNNQGKPADYFFQQGFIFVATKESPITIITIERQWHRKLGTDFWYAEEEAAESLAIAK